MYFYSIRLCKGTSEVMVELSGNCNGPYACPIVFQSIGHSMSSSQTLLGYTILHAHTLLNTIPICGFT